MLVSMARKRDLQADARQRAAEVPAYALQESIQALEAAIPFADGDLQVWLQAAQDELQRRERTHRLFQNNAATIAGL